MIDNAKLSYPIGSLRDARGRFVIGNVAAGWHVRETDVHDGPWTKVYVPNAERRGWIEDIHLKPGAAARAGSGSPVRLR